MKSNPFARAKAMMALIAMSGLNAALSQMGEYVSRGHGQNKPSGKGQTNSGTPWREMLGGQTNGKREIARRRRQLNGGIIHN